MAEQVVGLMCLDAAGGTEWAEELAGAGLSVRRVENMDEADKVAVLLVRARTAEEARTILPRAVGRGQSRRPVLVLLDEGDSAARAAILEGGADDCLTQPVLARELGARLGRMISQAELARETARHSAILRREMAHARRVQEHILPLDPPQVEGLEIVAEYLPAEDIGGDFFDIIRFGTDRVAFFMADVAGHGIGAALNTMLIKSQLVIWARAEISVTETLAMLNNYLHALTDLDYATAVYAVLDVPARRLEYAVAGHPNPLLLRDGEPVRMLEVSNMPAASSGFRAGLPLGLFEDGVYLSSRADLRQGDRVLFFTDGLIEWRDTEGNLLGTEGLRELLEASRDRPLKEQIAWLLGELQSLAPGAPPADDVNLLALRIH